MSFQPVIFVGDIKVAWLKNYVENWKENLNFYNSNRCLFVCNHFFTINREYESRTQFYLGVKNVDAKRQKAKTSLIGIIDLKWRNPESISYQFQSILYFLVKKSLAVCILKENGTSLFEIVQLSNCVSGNIDIIFTVTVFMGLKLVKFNLNN